VQREERGVRVQRRLAAQMGIEHGSVLRDLAASGQVDQPRHRLPLVDGVGDHSLQPGGEPDRVERPLVGDAVGAGVVALVEDELVAAELTADLDQRGSRLRDPRHLLERLARLRRGVDPDHAARPVLRGESGDHARLGRAGHRADDDGVKEDPELCLLLGHLLRPARVAEAAQRVVGRAGRNRIGLPAARLDVGERLLPAFLEPDAERRLDQPYLGPEDPGEEDVPDPVVDHVGPVDPALLDEHAAEAGTRGRGRHLPRVVRLHAADGDQRVAALRQPVRDQVLQLARLVPAEGEAGRDVVPLRPDPRAAEMLGQAVEPVDRRRPEDERKPLETVERHSHDRGGTSRTSPLCW